MPPVYVVHVESADTSLPERTVKVAEVLQAAEIQVRQHCTDGIDENMIYLMLLLCPPR